MKVTKLKKNATNTVKKSINKMISSYNIEIGSTQLKRITGDYSPRYLYSNMKIHKPGSLQISTPISHLAKTFNNIITSGISSKYSVKSTLEFLH